MHALKHNYSELKDSSAQSHFNVALHETVGRTESLSSQDSEDKQQEFSRAHSIKLFLPSFYL